MKARLNILGRKFEVVSIRYYQDKVEEVQVLVGHNEYKTFYNEKSASFQKIETLVNMEEALEFPEIEERIVDERNKLIEHLEEFQSDENEYLTHLAINAMETDELPFEELSLIEKQKEYKLRQQRVMGVIDTVEEVKAFTEGFYAKVDDAAVEAEEYHQSIE
ncbi:hypothetical protein [Sporosarcina sp. FSL K6-1508]|uniref:hypothetical protein n=1 Tax=Sporosarcina sp. FSL K6-1508 TaxID=2921553 RepID=UPI0030F95274